MLLLSKTFTFFSLRTAVAACALGSMMSAVQAEATYIQIIAFGEFGPPPGDSQAPPENVVELFSKVETNKLVRWTNCITAKLGTRMGLLLKHTGANGTHLPVEVELHHPPYTSLDGRTRTVESWSMNLSHQPLYTGWHFDESHELVPGHYIMKIVRQGQIVYSEHFIVVLSRSDCTKHS
ncbi:DUF3859 domain-containing protein [Microvirga guangxiensis]|uniref:DUF3859 domain-containing protein n=1 Tax=Microvirga guangxiensis TaxID=549386 RepID=A0A1G5GK57_9HYPH|nr:DUF3859 domain-containing protein [Microvirga guangxiensis]SCY51962.1 protein of unknown function [Microvirga guangxiensis]